MCPGRIGWQATGLAGVRSVTVHFSAVRTLPWWAAEIRHWRTRCISPAFAKPSICWCGKMNSAVRQRLYSGSWRRRILRCASRPRSRKFWVKTRSAGITVTQNGTVETIPLSGVFVAIGLSPDTSLYGDLVETDPSGYIVAGEDCRTSVPGIFAAGDIRTKVDSANCHRPVRRRRCCRAGRTGAELSRMEMPRSVKCRAGYFYGLPQLKRNFSPLILPIFRRF